MEKSLDSRVHYGHKRPALEDYVATLAFSEETLRQTWDEQTERER